MLSAVLLWAWRVAVLLELLALARLVALGLYTQYWAFAIWMILDLLGSALALSVYTSPQIYFNLYPILQSSIYIFQVIAVFRIFSLHLAHYRGIGSAGRWILGALVAAAAFSSTLITKFHGTNGSSTWLIQIVSWEQAMSVGLAAFLILTIVLFRFISIQTRRNILEIERIMAFYFIIQSAVFFSGIASGMSERSLGEIVGSILAAGSAVITFGWWTLAISKAGERLRSPTMPNNEEYKRAEQLDEEMLRFLRSFRWSPSKGLH